jgi:AbrB family looped-hinge helix DNA binding protein
MRHLTVVMCVMAIAHSKLTRQGQISVPSEIRRRLGLGPGSVIEWVEEGGQVVVRHSGRHSSEDIHKALFAEGKPEPVPLEEMKASIGRHVRGRRARGRY